MTGNAGVAMDLCQVALARVARGVACSTLTSLNIAFSGSTGMTDCAIGVRWLLMQIIYKMTGET
jgi:hypothetical protein